MKITALSYKLRAAQFQYKHSLLISASFSLLAIIGKTARQQNWMPARCTVGKRLTNSLGQVVIHEDRQQTSQIPDWQLDSLTSELTVWQTANGEENSASTPTLFLPLYFLAPCGTWHDLYYILLNRQGKLTAFLGVFFISSVCIKFA